MNAELVCKRERAIFLGMPRVYVQIWSCLGKFLMAVESRLLDVGGSSVILAGVECED